MNEIPINMDLKNVYDLCESDQLSYEYKQYGKTKTLNEECNIKSHVRECIKYETYASDPYRDLISNHREKMPFQCPVCSCNFDHKFDLEIHLQTHDLKSYQCSNYDENVPEEVDLNKHIEGNFRKSLHECSECNIYFLEGASLIKHMKNHSSNLAYKCNECDKVFYKNFNLKRHMKTHNKKCSECGKNFPNSSSLKRHIKTHAIETSFQCKQCEKVFSLKRNLTRHMEIHTGERAFHCNQCDRNFTRKSHLKDHMKIHTGEKAFQCNHCGRTFTRKLHLEVHIRSIHEKQKTFHCNLCDRYFARKSTLQEHISSIHNNEKPFQCSLCNIFLVNKRNLLAHLKTHTNEEFFRCSHCNAIFSHSQTLKSHFKEKHGDNCNVTLKKQTKCIYSSCRDNFHHHGKLIKHLLAEHSADIKSKTLDFKSIEDFLTWKEIEEASSLTYYSKQTATRKTSKGSTMYFRCQRDGRSYSHRKKGEESRKTSRRNKKSSVKTDMFCPSRILCKIDSTGAVNITYITSHTHPVQSEETGHQQISKDLLEDIEL